MAIRNNLRYTEFILLILVWVVLIAAPVFFRSDSAFSWQDMEQPLRVVIPLFFIFLINRFLLVPVLLLKKKSLLYMLAVFGTIAVFTLGFYFFGPKPVPNRPPPHSNMQQPPPHYGPPDVGIPPPNQPAKQGPIPPFANLLIFSILLVGFDTGLITSFRLAKKEREHAKLEKENIESKLAFLRNQVSPHFFMNTLNNIHSLIDIDSEEAKESVIRLSKLMRHLLYDSEQEKIPLRKEIDFIQNYVDLMKLRFSEKVNIELKFQNEFPDKSIPPLLFTSFVENAFKHGISYEKDSFIKMQLLSNVYELTFDIRNSNPAKPEKEAASGIGVENARKRLDLIYGDTYSLVIDDTPQEYHVLLKIPV